MAIITNETIQDESGVQQTAHPRTEVDAIVDVTDLTKAILKSPDATTIFTKLGVTSYVQGLLQQASSGDFQSALGISEFVKSALAGADAGDVLNDILPKTAQAHNGMYRGKDLTAYYNNGGFSKAVAAGTFDDIFPGDYITKTVTVDGTTYTDVKWIVGDLDYHLHRGDTETTAHHVVLYPETNLGSARMNATDTTSGGYQGSEMWKTTIPKYTTGIVNAFGSDHVLKHRERLTKAVDTNAYSAAGGVGNGASVYADGEWTDVTVNLFNEAMMYGHAPFASSGRDVYDCNKQLASFRYGQNFTRSAWCWLRDVASAIYFAYAGNRGEADYGDASNVGGVRPYFLLR